MSMNLLLHLPHELLLLIFSFLRRQSLARLSSTCHAAYDICLPTLYAQVHLGLRAHVRQLEQGLRQRPKLKDTMQKCTTSLTITNQQNCNMWMTRDFTWLFDAATNVRQLTLVHFDGLYVEYLRRLAQQLPAVERLCIQYSHLKSAQDENTDSIYHEYHRQRFALMSTSTSSRENLTVFSKATHLRLCWTDFSEAGVAGLFRLLPNVQQVDLGANRNKIQGANTAAVKAIAEHCSQVTNLAISLQQVSESILCDTIAYYGSQLHSLSIRCDGRDTLRCVARHATQVKDLTIRAGSILPPTSTPPTPQRHQQQQQQAAAPTLGTTHHETANDISAAITGGTSRRRQVIATEGSEPEHGTIVGILQQCPLLVRLEMVSWLVEDVPREVWRGIEAVASRRKAMVPLLMHRDARHESKTLALGMEELQEIRNQIMAEASPAFSLHDHPLAAISR